MRLFASASKEEEGQKGEAKFSSFAKCYDKLVAFEKRLSTVYDTADGGETQEERGKRWMAVIGDARALNAVCDGQFDVPSLLTKIGIGSRMLDRYNSVFHWEIPAYYFLHPEVRSSFAQRAAQIRTQIANEARYVLEKEEEKKEGERVQSQK